MNQTKVTFKTFLAWKKRKVRVSCSYLMELFVFTFSTDKACFFRILQRLEKIEAGLSAKAKREADFKQGRTTGVS